MADDSGISDRLASLEERFEALERTLNEGPPPVIAAAGLFLMDGEILCGSLSTPPGAVLLSLASAIGKPGVLLGTAENGSPMLAVLDRGSGKRIDFQIAPNDAPAVYLNDTNGAIRVRCEVDPNDAPAIGLCDHDVQARAAIGVNRTGNPFLGTR